MLVFRKVCFCAERNTLRSWFAQSHLIDGNLLASVTGLALLCRRLWRNSVAAGSRKQRGLTSSRVTNCEQMFAGSRGILWCSLSWSETKTVICPLSRFLFAAFKLWRFRVLKATISGQEFKPISPPRLRDPKGATMNNRGPMAASTPRRSVKGFRLGQVTRPQGRRIASLKLSCYDHFSSALQWVVTFLGIICGEKAVTDAPSTQRKTRCCGN